MFYITSAQRHPAFEHVFVFLAPSSNSVCKYESLWVLILSLGLSSGVYGRLHWQLKGALEIGNTQCFDEYI